MKSENSVAANGIDRLLALIPLQVDATHEFVDCLSSEAAENSESQPKIDQTRPPFNRQLFHLRFKASVLKVPISSAAT
jgi:hypothetical protein